MKASKRLAALCAALIIIGIVTVLIKNHVRPSSTISEQDQAEVNTAARVPASLLAPVSKNSTRNQTSSQSPTTFSEADHDAALKADAEYRANRDEKLSKRWQRISKLRDPHPVKFGSDGREYEFLPNVWALPRSKYVAASNLTPVDQEWGYVFVQTAAGDSAPPGAMPAAVSPAEHSLVVVTGAVAVKFGSSGISESFGQDFGLSLVRSLDDINVAYYQGPQNNGAELTALVDNLKRDPRVVRANLWIVDKRYVTN
jgi:Open reading frame 2 N-terminal domain